MQRKQVRTLFIAIFIFLPIQYVFVGIVGYYYSEPWPAFVFPGFKNAFIDQDDYEIDRTLFLISSEDTSISVTLTPHEFFPEIPNSQIAGFMRQHFRDGSFDVNFSDSEITWLEKQARQVFNKDVSKLKVIRNRECWEGKSMIGQPYSSQVIFEKVIYFKGRDGQ